MSTSHVLCINCAAQALSNSTEALFKKSLNCAQIAGRKHDFVFMSYYFLHKAPHTSIFLSKCMCMYVYWVTRR